MIISSGVYDRVGGHLAVVSAMAASCYVWPAMKALWDQGFEAATILGIFCLGLHIIICTATGSYSRRPVIAGDSSEHITKFFGCALLTIISYLLGLTASILHLRAGDVWMLIALLLSIELLRRQLIQANQFR